jgi:tetratricopeptide (TPR) repeat protein
MRLTVQLVATDSGDILWTTKFARPLAELMTLEEKLASEVAARLGVEIERIEMEKALRNSGEVTAREAIIRGDALIMGRSTTARAEGAIAEARRAVAIAPDYDAAHAALAGNLSVLLNLRGHDDPTLEQEILECVARSRALDPGSPLVLCRLAGALNSVGRHHDALALLRRAIAINPNLEVVRHTHGVTLMHLGRREEAMEEFVSMTDIAPDGMWADTNWSSRAFIHFHEGRYDEALASVRQGRRNADLLFSRLIELLSLARLGRDEEARTAMQNLRESLPEATANLIEKIVRNDFYYGPDPVRLEDNIETVRRLWVETGGDWGPRPPNLSLHP